MKKYKNDLKLAGIALLLALILFLLFFLKSQGGDAVVEVVADGKSYGTYSLLENRQVEILTAYGKNLLVIEDKHAYIAEADCPDKTCVKQGKIRRKGQTIICLPHKLTVRVIQGEEDDVDAAAGK